MTSLLQHTEDCVKLGPQKVILPNEDECWVKFKATQKMPKVPFVIYADFESYGEKIPTESDHKKQLYHMRNMCHRDKHILSSVQNHHVFTSPSFIAAKTSSKNF